MKTVKYMMAALFVCLVANGCGNNPKQTEIDSEVTNFYEKQEQTKRVFIKDYFDKAKDYAESFAKNKGYSVQNVEYQGFCSCVSESSGSFSFNVRTADISSTGGLITISITVEVKGGSMSVYHFQAYS